MTFLTPSQFFQLGRKCSHCEKNAKWLDKFNEKNPAYCDDHYPYWEYLNEKQTMEIENDKYFKK